MPRRFNLKPHYDQQTKKWMLSIPPAISKTGKRQRLFYHTQSEALRASKRLKRRYAQFGLNLRSLSPERLVMASAAFELLEGHMMATGDKASLQSILIAYIDKYNESHASIPFNQLIDEYVEARAHRTQEYLRKYESIKKRLGKLMSQKVSQIQTDSIVSVLPSSAGARNSLIKHLAALFNFAIKKGYVPSKNNPIDAIERTYVAPKEVDILSVELASAMLHYAHKHHPQFLAYLAIGLFTGTRPNELTLLEWRDILLDQNPPVLVIRPEVSKTRKKRFPELPDNLIAWLNVVPNAFVSPNKLILQLSPAQIRWARQEVWKHLAGNQSYVKTIMRHSYASYWLALHGDMNKLSLMLGHTSTVISMKHYHAAVPKVEGEKYFKLYPPNTVSGS